MSCLVRIPSYNRTWHSMDVFNGLLKNINLEPLNNEEKSTLKVFAGGVVETTDEVPLSLADLALAKKKTNAEFGNLKWIPPTSNIAERLFSKVKHEFTDYRKSLLPVNLESQIFLSLNCDFWSVHTVISVV